MKIVRTDRELTTPYLDKALREDGHELILLDADINEAELVDIAQDADLILMCYTPVTRSVINAATRLRGIVKYGVGIDAIDIPAAIARGIPVVNIPEYAEATVAEGAFAALLALCKKLLPLDRHMKREGWAWPEPHWLGSDIAGKTVGIVGFGKIGRSFARMAGPGFNARVIAYDPTTPGTEMQALGATKVDSLHDMLPQCDVLSLHATLRKGSSRLIGAAELALMKPAALLINTARGALVDEPALCKALIENRLGGAVLDVFSREPLSLAGHPLSPLFELDNVILTPHLSFYSAEAMERLERETLTRCREALSGGPVTVRSKDPRLREQHGNIIFPE